MLTLLSFNIGSTDEKLVSALALFLQNFNADIVGLQECDWTYSKTAVDTLRQTLNLHYYAIGVSSGTLNHILLLSRYPIEECESFKSFRNAGLLVTIHTPASLVSVAVVHLAPTSEQTRVNEMSVLLKSLNSLSYDKVIMGDLNAIARHDPVKYDGVLTEPILYDATSAIVSAGFTDVGNATVKSFIPTVPVTQDVDVTYYNLRLDYIYVSESLSRHQLTYKVIGNTDEYPHSDHRAIYVTID